MSFFKSVLATLTALFIAFLLLIFIMIGLIASSASQPEPYVRDSSVLRIELLGMVSERSIDDPFAEIFGSGTMGGLSLEKFRDNMKKATNDDRIKGIWLDMGFMGGSWSGLFEMRDLLQEFKSSGKFVYAYIGDQGANEAAYYLATVSDSIFAQPEAMFEFDGFFVQRMFYKDAFEKFGISADVLTSGPYKTAADSYRYDEFSDGDEEQLSVMLDQFSTGFVQAVSEYSGVTTDEINAMLNSLPTLQAATAYERGLIDGFMQPFEFKDMITERSGSSKLQEVTFARYSRVEASSAGLDSPTGKEIAVVFMEGAIMPDMPTDVFSASQDVITYKKFAKILDDLNEDNNVAAIVLRVNSPGGAVTTSEILRAHIAKVTESKPVVVSMGSVAASGGYYIAMGADSVFAEPNTITGSIGVVMAKLSAETLLEEKLGISVDEIKTHSNADWMTLERTLTADQYSGLQNDLNKTYDNFISLVADARELDRDYIHQHAQGRVWTGTDAHELGLIDGIGTLDNAITIAASMAELESWEVGKYPVPKTFIENMLESSQKNVSARILNIMSIQPDHTQLIRDLRNFNKMGAYSIVPFDITVN
ncbi:MAG TPA: signal peptide peptidase SppA [Bacteroidetes bacterium]|nr:signal peptide peptidase SppA [Bacteroidota bacterium]